MVNPELGHGAVLFCSEPLGDDVGWERVLPSHVVLVREDEGFARPLHDSGGEPSR